MPIKTEDLIKFAQVMLVKDASEVQLRAAMSRGYYYVYHESSILTSLLHHLTFPEFRGGVHEQVIKQFTEIHLPKNSTFTEQQERAIKSVGYQLSQLRADRLKADYNLDEEISLEDTRLTITAALRCASDIELARSKIAN